MFSKQTAVVLFVCMTTTATSAQEMFSSLELYERFESTYLYLPEDCRDADNVSGYVTALKYLFAFQQREGDSLNRESRDSIEDTLDYLERLTGDIEDCVYTFAARCVSEPCGSGVSLVPKPDLEQIVRPGAQNSGSPSNQSSPVQFFNPDNPDHYFQQVGPNEWGEFSNGAQTPRFTFTEKSRSVDVVLIHDEPRGIQIRLPLNGDWTQLNQGNGWHNQWPVRRRFEGQLMSTPSTQPRRPPPPRLLEPQAGSCPTAPMPGQLTASMARNGVEFGSHCYYLANGHESCTDACRRMGGAGNCDAEGLAFAAQSVDQCKSSVAVLGGPGGLDHSRSGQYSDNDSGCTYGDWGRPDNRWVQVMRRGAARPTCDSVDGDSSRMRVCACN